MSRPETFESLDHSAVLSSDGSLSSRVLPHDQELSDLADEVDQISKIAESESTDARVLTQTLRRAASCVARQALLERELRSLALFDDLTGLHNRRAFCTLATQELVAATRNRQSLLIFFADIDYLKQINDVHGHQEGDLAIIRAARALQQTFRTSDIIARLGGDEFGAIAVEADEHHGGGILNRLTASLRALSAKETRYELVLSVGTARFSPETAMTLAELMQQADRCMYEQKRNRTSLRTTAV